MDSATPRSKMSRTISPTLYITIAGQMMRAFTQFKQRIHSAMLTYVVGVVVATAKGLSSTFVLNAAKPRQSICLATAYKNKKLMFCQSINLEIDIEIQTINR
jgi:hypothetical protein